MKNEGITQLLDNTTSIIVEKASELTINTQFSWETVIGAFFAAALPSCIAWLAIRSNKLDNKANRDATLNAAKLATYAQTTSESTRKNIDTVITLIAHFMGYCTALILSTGDKSNKFDYSKNRLDLVLINNKLKLLITDDYLSHINANISLAMSRKEDSDLILDAGQISILSKINSLLDMTEYYYCKLNSIETSLYYSHEITRKHIEKELFELTKITKEYISFKEKKLNNELIKN